MIGHVSPVLDLLRDSGPLTLPAHQAPYEPQRDELELVLDSLRHPDAPKRYLGEAYVVNADYDRERSLVIDPGQWLTTVTLLLVAVIRMLEPNDPRLSGVLRRKYVIRDEGMPDERHRLELIGQDHGTLRRLLAGQLVPEDVDSGIQNALEYLEWQLEGLDLSTRLDGLRTLMLTAITVPSAELPPHVVSARVWRRPAAPTLAQRFAEIAFLNVPASMQERLHAEIWRPLELEFADHPLGLRLIMGEIVKGGGPECAALVRAGHIERALELTAGADSVVAWAQSLARRLQLSARPSAVHGAAAP